MRKNYILATTGVVLVLAALYFLAFRSGAPGADAAGPGGGPGGFGGAPSVVTAEPVEQGAFSMRTDFVGTLRGIASADLYAKTTGPIVRLHAETGDRVRAGQVLAQIDDAEERE